METDSKCFGCMGYDGNHGYCAGIPDARYCDNYVREYSGMDPDDMDLFTELHALKEDY